ncbi:MAG: cell wall hydrolase [Lachnospiraceae bacterium]|nr:cell wall hydrolase [Lachnospiraceae bacterium]
MHKRTPGYNLIAYLLCAVCIFSCMAKEETVNVHASVESTSKKIKEAEELKKATEQMKDATEQKKEGLVDQKQELESYLSELNDNLTKITENIGEIEDRISDKQEEITHAEEELEAARSEEEVQYELMKKRIKFMYERGDRTLVSTFFRARSYADFLNKAEYTTRVEDYDKKMYDNLAQIRKDVEEKESVLKEEEEQLQSLKRQAQTEEKKVNNLVTSTNGSIAQTDGQISAAELETAAYEAELAAQEENLAALRKQLAEEQAMIAKASKMAWRDISELEFQDGDRDLLACLIYCEAGNQPYTGQVAVGAVVINRVRSAAYPNTVSGVIYQRGQFSPVGSGRLATRLALGATSACYQAADEAMRGATPVGNCLYFRTVIPQINGTIIGDHVFY